MTSLTFRTISRQAQSSPVRHQQQSYTSYPERSKAYANKLIYVKQMVQGVCCLLL